jgi:hypothetical protein
VSEESKGHHNASHNNVPNFPVHVTKGHEREALEAQRRKKPSRIGESVLKILGFKGEVGPDRIE